MNLNELLKAVQVAIDTHGGTTTVYRDQDNELLPVEVIEPVKVRTIPDNSGGELANRYLYTRKPHHYEDDEIVEILVVQ